MNEQIKQDLEAALSNTENVREKIKEQLEEIQKSDKPDSKQLHLLVDYKLELLDIKLRLKDMIRNLHLIKFD